MMLRRSALALSRRRLSIGRVPRQEPTSQIFSSVCHRREFSSVPSQNGPPHPGSRSKPSGSRNTLPKFIVGSVAIGTGFYVAYSKGYLNDILGRNQQSADSSKVEHSSIVKSPEGNAVSHDFQNIKEPVAVHTSEDSQTVDSHAKGDAEKTERQSATDLVGDSGKNESESDLFAENSSDLTKETIKPVKEDDLSKVSDDLLSEGEKLSESSFEETSKKNSTSPESSDSSADMKFSGEITHLGRHEADEDASLVTDVDTVVHGNNKAKDETAELKLQEEPKELRGSERKPSASLLNTYHLEDKANDGALSISEQIKKVSSSEDETSPGALGDSGDAYVSKDGKLILDFLQAIHAAEQRQAELDAHVFSEEKRSMKEKYEKELKDARARELMYAEEAAMLEKEVKKERAKAAAALKSLQERAEERLKLELEEKEREADSKLKEVQDFAKAELAASIAREKAAQIEKMAEANLNISALCMAFYARSEEARQTHSIHKLALGALALEDALSNGLPVQAELEALHLYIDNVDKDSLLQLALSSVPDDVREHGTDTLLQLNQKFDALKGKLRHFSLIPPDGGGILSHSLAHVASFLKIKEADQSGDGIESVLNKVESLLAQGKLAEAADVLEDGVKGSKATEVVGDWLRGARNRAIAEQTLNLLQAYTASVSLT